MGPKGNARAVRLRGRQNVPSSPRPARCAACSLPAACDGGRRSARLELGVDDRSSGHALPAGRQARAFAARTASRRLRRCRGGSRKRREGVRSATFAFTLLTERDLRRSSHERASGRMADAHRSSLAASARAPSPPPPQPMALARTRTALGRRPRTPGRTTARRRTPPGAMGAQARAGAGAAGRS